MPDLQLAFSLVQCATIFVQHPTIIFSTHLSFDSRADFNNALVTCCKNYLCIFTNFIPPRWIKFIITFDNSPIHHCFIVWVKWFISTQSVAMKKATLYINWPCGKDILQSFVWNNIFYCIQLWHLLENLQNIRYYSDTPHINFFSIFIALQNFWSCKKRSLYGTLITEPEKSELYSLRG